MGLSLRQSNGNSRSGSGITGNNRSGSRGNSRSGRGTRGTRRGRGRPTGSLQQQIPTRSGTHSTLIQEGSTMGLSSSRSSGRFRSSGTPSGSSHSGGGGIGRGNANSRGSMIIPGSMQEHDSSSVSAFCNTQPIHIRDSGSLTGLSHDVT
jgi:hypothetical protein